MNELVTGTWAGSTAYDTDTATCILSLMPECRHLNGSYIYPKFFGFKKEYFFCTDCNRLIDMKDMERK